MKKKTRRNDKIINEKRERFKRKIKQWRWQLRRRSMVGRMCVNSFLFVARWRLDKTHPKTKTKWKINLVKIVKRDERREALPSTTPSEFVLQCPSQATTIFIFDCWNFSWRAFVRHPLSASTRSQSECAMVRAWQTQNLYVERHMKFICLMCANWHPFDRRSICIFISLRWHGKSDNARVMYQQQKNWTRKCRLPSTDFHLNSNVLSLAGLFSFGMKLIGGDAQASMCHSSIVNFRLIQLGRNVVYSLIF